MNKKTTIDDVLEFSIKGPWTTKSSANLDVLTALTHEQTESFFTYDHEELSITDRDIRGLRVYRVTGLKAGAVGGDEWHRIKKELVFVDKGRVKWDLVDQNGQKKEYILTPNNSALLIPAYIFHTYTALDDGSEVIVITNTLYDVDDESTFDTFSADSFSII